MKEEFLKDNLKRIGKADFKFSYNKITNIDAGRKIINKIIISNITL